MKKGLVILLAIILTTTIAVQGADGNFSIQKSYDWLLKQQNNGSFGGITETAATILALKSSGYNPTNSIEYINAQENAQHCWPRTPCRTKDTAFALLAYKSMGVATDDAVTWMKNAQSSAFQSGNWWLEVTTTDTGSCTVKYTKSSQEIIKTININNGRFTDCGNTTFMNLNNCLEANLLKNFPTLKLYVDCGGLSNALISLIYNSANSYYILTDSQNKVAEITVENGCFGLGYKEVCNYDSTLYSNWALNVLGVGSSSKVYLKDNYDKTNVLHNSLLYTIFKDNKNLEELKARQRSDGSWDNDVYKTALAVLAMKGEADYSSQFNNGVNWLKTKQKSDGSFGDVTTTAMVLYAAFTEEGGIDFPSCTNDKKDAGEEGVDCGGLCPNQCEQVVCIKDGKCDEDIGEDCNNCPDDCKSCEDLCDNGVKDDQNDEEGIDCGGQCSKKCKQAVCDNNGVCDLDLVETGRGEENENADNCPSDCTGQCGDSVCDSTESVDSCSKDCQKEEKPEECGDRTCDSTKETNENCPEDCEAETAECNNDETCDEGEGCTCVDCKDAGACRQPSTFPWMWVLIILIILFAGVMYMVYKKKSKSKKKGPELFGFGKPLTKKPEIREFKVEPVREEKKTVTITAPLKSKVASSKVEEELEQSIKEAKKLLGKK